MKTIVKGICIAVAALSVVGSLPASATETEREKKTNRHRRLRRAANVVKVDKIQDADRSKQRDTAAQNIYRILNDERTNTKTNTKTNTNTNTIRSTSSSTSSSSTSSSTNTSSNSKTSNHDDRQLLAAGMIEEVNNKRVIDDEDVLYMMTHMRQRQFFSIPGEPTKSPTRRPTRSPSMPIREPTIIDQPTRSPTYRPTPNPNPVPTRNPTLGPTDRPIKDPTYNPTRRPTNRPTPSPTKSPTDGTPTDPSPTPVLVCNGLTLDERQTLISAQLATYSGSRVNLPGTPQYQAFQWLLNEDAVQVCPDDFLDVKQRYILAVLYFSTYGDNWNNCNEISSTNPSPCLAGDEGRFLSSSDVCFWFGVSCNRKRVSGISIDENNLRGFLPDEIGYLEQIEDLDFDGELEEGLNYLIGTIPTTFGLLTKLVTLDLDMNELTGSIPEEIFDAERLTIIDLDSNELTGTLSEKFANLEELQILFLDNNGFFGTLPAEMGEMERLRFLRLDRNELGGTIPDEWEAMEKLRVLFLNNNREISGTIPKYLGDFIDMQQLSLFDTGIAGTIPSSLGKLTSLVNLFLHFTDLTGTMPQEICDLRTSGALNFLTADCAGDNPKMECSQPDCCTVCF